MQEPSFSQRAQPINRPMPELGPDGLPVGYSFQALIEVAPRQVRVMIETGEDFLLLDCRTPREFEVARLENGLLVPLQELGVRLEELKPYSGKKVVVYCHHGMRSLRAAIGLRQQGLTDTWSMAGGIDLWSVDIDPAVPRY